MRNRWLLRIGLMLALATAAAAEPASPAQVDRLIGQLGSKSFAERERAMQALDDLGPSVLDALRRASKSRDTEISRRAAELVERIEKRGETTRMLAPRRVRLVFQDTPVPEAVAEFARKSGYRIVLAADQGKLAGRKVSLDTGDVTFWEAFDQFCARVGLVEGEERGPRPKLPVPGGAGPAAPPGGGAPAGVGLVMRLPPPPVSEPTPKLVLRDGKPQPLPTCYAGAVRIRALPPETKLPEQQPRKGDIVFALEMSSEPRLEFMYLVAVQIEKAVDDHGQSLSPPVPVARVSEDEPDAVSRPTLIWVAGQRAVLLRLKKADKDSRSLKELAGRLAVRVRTEPSPVIQIDNVLQAAGKTARGRFDGSVKLVEIGRDDAGQVTLGVELQIPAGAQPAAGAVAAPKAGGAARPAVMYRSGLALFDAKGQPLPLTTTRAQIRTMGNIVVHFYTFVCRSDKAGPEPAKLVFFANRLLAMDIPFALKDVPLPR